MADKTNPTASTSQGSDLIPKIYQSDANKKFIQATVDQLIQSGTVNKVNGFIGRENAKASTGADIFVKAADQTRQNYQLEPGLTVQDTLGNATFFKDYQDYINQLNVFGSNTLNHARLNKQEMYSWDPHIDWDKFVNFNDYYWLPYGPDSIQVYGQQNAISSTYISVITQDEKGNDQYLFTPDGLTPNPTIKLYRGQTYHFDVNSPGNPFTIKTARTLGVVDYYTPPSGLPKNAVAVGTVTFTVPADAPDILYYVSNRDPDLGGVFEIFDITENTDLDIIKDVLGKKTYTLPDGTALSNGMKVQFRGNITPIEYATGNWYVEGVGTAITLIKETVLEVISPYTTNEAILFDTTPFDARPFADASGFASIKDYILINRASQDHNAWSRYNRWFHKDVITTSAKINGNIPELNQESRAIRPIIEFEADLKLFNFGNVAINDVDVIDTVTTDAMSNVEGAIGYIVDSITLIEGHRILFVADTDILVRNQIFTVQFVMVGAQRQIHLVPTQLPTTNNTILVKSGKINQSKMFWYDGAKWVEGQQKTTTNQPPLFDIVDSNRVSFSDMSLTAYPGSTFKGTTLFSYKQSTGSVDTALGFPLTYKNIDNIGDIVFNFALATDSFTYKTASDVFSITINTGFLIKTGYTQQLSYVNGWKTCVVQTTQAGLRIYKNSNITNNFNIDIFDNINNLSDLVVRVYVNGIRSAPTDWTVVNGVVYKKVVFNTPVKTSDVVTIKTYALQPINSNGYYEIPPALQNNPFNNEILDFTLGEVIDHVASIIDNTPKFIGAFPGAGNLRDIGNSTGYGTKFVQHSGPLSLGLYHITTESNNIIKAIEKSRDDYQSFKRNFLTVATSLGLDTDVVTQVNTVLERINQDKPKTGAYYSSDMAAYGAAIRRDLTVVDYRIQDYPLSTVFSLDVLSTRSVLVYLNQKQLLHGRDYTFDSQGFVVITAKLANGDKITTYEFENTNGSFIPETPTKLGLWPKYQPKIYLDTSLINPTTVIQGHDGSQIVAFGDYRDAIILELEMRIYNNIKAKYDSTIFDIHDLIPSYNRTTDYSLVEFNETLSPSFYKWAVNIGKDFTQPVSYDRNNPLTFNYRGHYTPDGRDVPGYWRGIYRWMYDTDRPGQAPWEMLGFSEEPNWWISVYGPAPYTSDNLVMWQDLAAGLVKDPSNPSYVIPKFVRSYLLDHIPVDDQGNILNPYLAGVARGANTGLTDGDYVFGDVGPIEAAWRRSSHYPFSVIRTALVLLPANTFGVLLDRSRIVRNLAGQLIYTNTGLRVRPSDIQLPSIYSSNTVSLTAGLINYLVDYILSDTLLSYKSYQYDLDNLTAKLSYRVGSFTSKEKFNLLLDSKTPLSTGSIFVPQENYNIILNSSSPVKKITYSGVIVNKLSDRFEVRGYSQTEPYFKYYQYLGSGATINIGGISESHVVWTPYQQYISGQVVGYNKQYYRVISTHTADTTFVPKYYSVLPGLPIVNGTEIILRTKWDRQKPIVVPYGTDFTTIQQVVDFLQGYGEYLKDQGFIFDEFNTNLASVTNWETSAKEFAFWTTQNWSTGQDKWKDWVPNQPVAYQEIVKYNGDYYQSIQKILPTSIFDSTKYIKLDGLSSVGSSVISLSPAADLITFATPLSVADSIENSFNTYEIFKVDGTPLEPNFINMYRKDNTTTYKTTTADGIFGASFYLVQKEQVILLDNTTLFNDTIYNPETGYRQERIKVSGYVSTNWHGSFDVPGFIFDQAKIQYWQPWQDYSLGDTVKYKEFYYSADQRIVGSEKFSEKATDGSVNWVRLLSKPSAQLLPNWTYKASQFTDFYSLDSDNFDASQQKVAQHLIGYQKRQYLSNIIQDDVSEFKFYQGMIREKGTQNVLNKLFDVLSADNKESLTFYEEWAVRLGEYGASQAYEQIEFTLDEALFKNNPQGIQLTDSLAPPYYDLVIRQTPTDIYLKPIGYNSNPWPLVNNYRSFLRSAGFPRLSDVKISVPHLSDILSVDITPFTAGDYIWVGFEGTSWNVYRMTSSHFNVLDITYSNNQLVITSDADHTLAVGDYIGIKEVTGFAGFYRVIANSKVTITVDAPNLVNPPSSPFTEQHRVIIYVLTSNRAPSINDGDQRLLRDIKVGEKVWIDSATFYGQKLWSVWENIPVYTPDELVYGFPSDDLGLGRSVHLSQDGLLLVSSTNTGQIFVWDKPTSVSTNWTQRESINVPLIAKSDSFGDNPNPNNIIGEALALSYDNNWLAVGTPAASYAVSHWIGTWSQSSTYSLDDIVLYDGLYYQATDAVPTNSPPVVTATAQGVVAYAPISSSTVGTNANSYSVNYKPTATYTTVSTITVNGTTGLYVGQNVTGIGIANNTFISGLVVNVNNTSTITLTHAVISVTTSTTITFGGIVKNVAGTAVFQTTTIVVDNATGIIPGMLVTGPGMTAGTLVIDVDTINNIVVLDTPTYGQPSGKTLFGTNTISIPFTYASGISFGMTAIGVNIPANTTITGSTYVSLGTNYILFLSQQVTGTVTSTGTFAIVAKQTTAAIGSSTLVVANNTNILVGQTASGTGIPASATVTNVSGTTITINVPTTGVVNSVVIFGRNQLSVSGVLGTIAPTQLVTGSGIPSLTTVSRVSGSTIFLNSNITQTVYGPLQFAGSSDYWIPIEYIPVDATGTNSGLTAQGAVSIYKKDSNNIFTLVDTILSPNPTTDERFGSSLAFVNHSSATGQSAYSLFVGAPGADTGAGRVYQLKYENFIQAVSEYNSNGSSDSAVVQLIVTASGSGYITNPTVNIGTPTVSGGVPASATSAIGVVNIKLIQIGTGYQTNDLLTVIGGIYAPLVSSSTQAAIIRVASVNNIGAITSAVIYSTGSYTSAATTTVSGITTTKNIHVSGGHGSDATFDLLYGVVSIKVTTPGSGYDKKALPLITFSSTTGSEAAAYASIGSTISVSDTTNILPDMLISNAITVSGITSIGTAFVSNQTVTQVIENPLYPTVTAGILVISAAPDSTPNGVLYFTTPSWAYDTVFTAPALQYGFGTTLVTNTSGIGNSLVVGAPGQTVAVIVGGIRTIQVTPGAATVFRFDSSNGWQQSQVISGTVYGYGSSVALSSYGGYLTYQIYGTLPFVEYLAVGSPLDESGKVEIYYYDDAVNEFVLYQELFNPRPKNQGQFGYKLAFGYISDTLVVYSNNADALVTTIFDSGETIFDSQATHFRHNEINSGSISVYDADSNTGTKFTFGEMLENPAPANSKFGNSFAIGTWNIVVGAPTAIITAVLENCTITGTILTVGNIIDGQIISGMILSGQGIVSGTTVVSGNSGTYVVSISQTVSNVTITGTSTVSSGKIYEYTKPAGLFAWNVVHLEEQKVDISKIKRAFIYDKTTNQVLTYLDIIDPVQGRIAGPAEQEIKYKSFDDPAIYSQGDSSVTVKPGMAWGPAQVGQIWWDLSTAKFIDSHDNDIAYRTSNWATLFPGASIDIYEWVGTSYTPDRWNSLADTDAGLTQGISGNTLYGSSIYSIVTKYDTISNSAKNTYYFWVKNKTTIPNTLGRSISAQSVSNLIANPRGEGYKFLALTGSSSIALFNVKPLLKNADAVLSVEYWTIDNPDQRNIHRQYAIISNDTNTTLPAKIEEKWIDSLCGKDANDREVPDLNLPSKLRYGIEFRPRQSMFINRYEALKQVIEQTNLVMAANQIAEQCDIQALNMYEAEPNSLLGEYDAVKDTDTELAYINIGNFVSPKLTPIIVDGRITGINIVDSGSGYLQAPYILVIGSGVGAVLRAIIDSTTGGVIDATVISSGHGYDDDTVLLTRTYSVLVHQDTQAGNSWSIYGYDTATLSWSRIRTQSYDVRKYRTYVDWYADNANQNTSPTFAVETFTDLATISPAIGDIVKVKNNSKGGWTLLQKYANSTSVDYTQSYQVIGIENGTVQFSSALYKFTDTVYGYDGSLYDGNNFDLTASNELRIILNTIKNNILIGSLKKYYLDLFFYNVRYAFSEQTELDWIFKTSFIKSTHNVGELDQPVTYRSDNLNNFEDYINEVKPYRTKIREYISNYSTVDIDQTMVSDFDLPGVYVNGLFQGINTGISNDKITADNNLITTYPWKNWLDNVGFSVVDLKIVDGGSGYISEPIVEFTSPTGSGVTARAFIASGKVNRIELTQKDQFGGSGKGYLSAPTIKLSGGYDATTGRSAKVVAIIGNSVIRTNTIGIKFDRITQNYFETNLAHTETFTGTGSRVQFALAWAPNITIGNCTVSIAESSSVAHPVLVLRDLYTLAITSDKTRGYTNYYGTITFTTAPAKGSIITVNYNKDWSLLNAADRIQFLYNPQSGQQGKELAQLMTGIDYGGVIVDGIGFEINSGWGSAPYYSDKWDSIDATSNDYIVKVSANTHTFTLPYTPTAGTLLNIYYSQLYTETFISDGATVNYTYNKRDIAPTVTVTAKSEIGSSHSVSGSTYLSNKAGSNVISLVSTTGITVNDTVTISPYIANTIALNTTVTAILNSTDVQISQILYTNIASGSVVSFTRALTVLTQLDPFGKGLITLNTPIVVASSGSTISVSSYLQPIRIDDDHFGSPQVANSNAVMQTVIADGVSNIITIPNTYPVYAGDEFIIRQSTSDGAFAPQQADYDTALTGGDLAYSSATGIAADDILVDGDQFVTPTTSPAPEEVVPGQVVDAVAIKIFEKPISGSATIKVDNYFADGVTTKFVMTQTPNSGGAVIVKTVANNIIQIMTVVDDYSIDYRNKQILFNAPPTVGTMISIFNIGYSGTNILDIDHFVGDGITTEFVTKANFITPTTSLVYIDGVAQSGEAYQLFKTDKTYVLAGLMGVRFAKPPAVGTLINYIIVTGNQQTFAVTKKERITPNGSATYSLQYPIGNTQPLEKSMIVRVDNTILQPPSLSYFTVANNKLNYVIDNIKFRPFTANAADFVVTANGKLLNPGVDYTVDLSGITVKITKVVYGLYKGTTLAVSIGTGAGYTYNSSTGQITFAQNYDAGHIIEVMTSYNHDILDMQTTTVNVNPTLTYTPDTLEFYNYKAISNGTVILDRPVVDSDYVWLEQNGNLLSPNIDYIVLEDKQTLQMAKLPAPNDKLVVLTFSNNILKSGIAYMQFKDMLNRVVFKRLNANKQTRLAVDLYPTDTTITVVNASSFDLPSPANNRPGIIEIRGERIEFFTITGNVLGQLRRGTLGTGVSDVHRSGAAVQEIGASETIPYQDIISTSQIVGDGTNIVPLSFTPMADAIVNGHTYKSTVDWKKTYPVGFTSSIPDGFNQADDIDVFVGGYNAVDWASGVSYAVGDIVNFASYQYKCIVANTSGTNFNKDIANWSYFIGNIRLKKQPYKVYNVSQAPNSPEGDVQFDAEFAVDGTTNSLRLTTPVAVGTRVTVVKRTGKIWDSTVNIQEDTSPYAIFVKAVPGAWYTGYNQHQILSIDSTDITDDNENITIDQG